MPALPYLIGAGVLTVAGINYTADNLTNNSVRLVKWGLLAGGAYAGFLAAKKAKLL